MKSSVLTYAVLVVVALVAATFLAFTVNTALRTMTTAVASALGAR